MYIQTEYTLYTTPKYQYWFRGILGWFPTKQNSEFDLDPPRIFGENKYFQIPLDAAILHCFETYMLALFIVTPNTFPSQFFS